MADVLKMLVSTAANRAPSATTNTTIYTVPASTTAMVSRIMVCNRGGTATTFRIAIIEAAYGSATPAAQHYIAYDVPIEANDTVDFPVGSGLATGDLIVIYAGNANLTFTPMGLEVTP